MRNSQEPLYRLHASRLHLLKSGEIGLDVLDKYRFRARTQTSETENTTSETPAPDLRKEIASDIIEAMKECLKTEARFHKAAFAISRVHKFGLLEGYPHLAKAKEVLTQVNSRKFLW